MPAEYHAVIQWNLSASSNFLMSRFFKDGVDMGMKEVVIVVVKR